MSQCYTVWLQRHILSSFTECRTMLQNVVHYDPVWRSLNQCTTVLQNRLRSFVLHLTCLHCTLLLSIDYEYKHPQIYIIFFPSLFFFNHTLFCDFRDSYLLFSEFPLTGSQVESNGSVVLLAESSTGRRYWLPHVQ